MSKAVWAGAGLVAGSLGYVLGHTVLGRPVLGVLIASVLVVLAVLIAEAWRE